MNKVTHRVTTPATMNHHRAKPNTTYDAIKLLGRNMYQLKDGDLYLHICNVSGDVYSSYEKYTVKKVK